MGHVQPPGLRPDLHLQPAKRMKWSTCLQSIQRAPGSLEQAGEGCLPLLWLLQYKAEAEAGIQRGAEMNLTSRGQEEAGTGLPENVSSWHTQRLSQSRHEVRFQDKARGEGGAVCAENRELLRFLEAAV